MFSHSEIKKEIRKWKTKPDDAELEKRADWKWHNKEKNEYKHCKPHGDKTKIF